MSQTLGEKLRQAREERGISISEVAEQTRISALYLESIENDNYKPLPGGIFNKGFVKTYAKYVGVDENEALSDYARLAAAEESAKEPIGGYRPEVLTDDSSRSSNLPTVILAVLILAVMTAGVLFLLKYLRDSDPAPQTASNNANSATSNTNANAAATPTPAAAAAPKLDAAKIEFSSDTDISLTAVVDGKRSSILVAPGRSAIFEPKQTLKLSYSRSLAQAAKLSINGRPISLPATPENPRRAAIEFEINADTLPRIWETGAVTFGDAAAAPVAGVPPTADTNTATAVQPAATPFPGSTPRAARPTPTRTVTAATPRPATTQTPIVVGRPPATPRVNE